MKIQNTFNPGIIDKDNDERFVQVGTLTDAENFLVAITEGSDRGVGKNVTGNVLKTDYETDFDYTTAKTIGSGKNDSTNKIYNFLKSEEFDYLIEYDTVTNESVRVLQSSAGGVLNFIEGERILNVDIISSGEANGDLIAWSGDSNSVRIVNIARAKTWAINGFTEDEISVMKPSPIFAPQISLTTSVDGVLNNFIEDKFLTFAYRFEYADGYFSAISSWSKIGFIPRLFSLDYQTYENNGMLNLSNAVNINFNTGPREVVAVELLFRESEKENVYVIDNYKKTEESWGDNTIQSIQFSKSKIFKVLDNDQFFRNYDNVPLTAKAQSLIGNRIAYANYVEGYDLDNVVDFTVSFTSSEPFSSEVESVIEDQISATTYSNVVDFTEGIPDGGASPVDQMDYGTNTIVMDLAAASADEADFVIEVTPKTGFLDVEYNIVVREGTTLLQEWTGLSGNQTRTHTRDTNRDVQIYITSSEGLLYEMKLNYNLTLLGADRSRYDYFSYNQLSFPKDGGYGSTLVGDVVIDTIFETDLSTFDFSAGKQIRINLDLRSSLQDDFSPSVTFFYNITENYTDVAEFYANSSFKNQLEEAFSLSFRNNFISNIGTVVSYIPFESGLTGDVLSIQTISILYDIEEPGPVTVQKREFYLIDKVEFLQTEEDAFASMHSNRDYEIVMILMDEKGRKSTAIPSKTNTIHIPAENSATINVINVTTIGNPPSWAKYYKFAIKQPKRRYETIYGNVVYKDGIYRWIQLVGENKAKVKEGDILIVKSDYSGPTDSLIKTKVLEVSTQSTNFIEGNLLSTDEELVEEGGFYFKIKQGNFNINIGQESFQTFAGYGKRRYASRSFVTTEPLFGDYDAETSTFTPLAINSGSQIRFFVRMQAKGSIAFDNKVEVTVFAQEDYSSVRAWWEAEVEDLDVWTEFVAENLSEWEWADVQGTPVDNNQVFRVKPNRDGTASRDIITSVEFDINFAGGLLVFETEPIDELETPFFETPQVYTIEGGTYQFINHTLNEAFNCFCFGNGVESNRIQDGFTKPQFSSDSNATLIDQTGYKRVNRFADITYSGVFNSNTSLNRLNEFNLSLANFKDDLEKNYGPVYKIKGKDTNLDVYQEDKVSKVMYEKDVLFNADGSSNVSKIEQVLGQQVDYNGEFGISTHPDSFDEYGFNSYFTDVKRGVVLKKNFNNGIFEISNQGMRSYFKNLFRKNILHVNGKYDQFHDIYILNIQYTEKNSTKECFETWVYSDVMNGWLGRLTFNPEDMIRSNGEFYSFKNGEVYIHNQKSIYNTFYGKQSPSKVKFNLNKDVNIRKVHKTIEIDGTDPWDVKLKTNLNEGYIDIYSFVKQEGIFRSYIRNLNDNIETSLIGATQGLGSATINGNVLEFDNEIDPIISVGDKVVNESLILVGTIISKTNNSLTLNSISNYTSGGFLICTKTQSVEQNSLLGYYMQVEMTLSLNTKSEVFSVSSEVDKSFS
jgi:hypothetical protein